MPQGGSSAGAASHQVPAVVALVLLPVPVAFVAWVAYGWAIGFVPFVPDGASLDVDTPPSIEGEPVRAALTGIVGLQARSIRRRYRNRPSVILVQGGEINLLVDRWKTQYVGRQRSYAAVVSMSPAELSDVVRGTAYLVTAEKPAVRMRSPNGPILLAFASREARDLVYGRLARSTSRTSMSLDIDLESLLESPQPIRELRAILVERLASGWTREDLDAELTKTMLAMRAADRSAEEELLLDGLDLLCGWVSPDMRI
jgi:hypothetical protein